MEHLEYLVRYGLAGEFGRFRADCPLALSRGARVVVRSQRGVELGEVMRPATPRHAAYLPNTSVGRLLRPAGAEEITSRRRRRPDWRSSRKTSTPDETTQRQSQQHATQHRRHQGERPACAAQAKQ